MLCQRISTPALNTELKTLRLTAEVVQNLGAASGVAYGSLGAILNLLVAPNPAPDPSPLLSSIAARLPWARLVRLQQLHRLLWLLCVFSNLGSPRVQNCREVERQKP